MSNDAVVTISAGIIRNRLEELPDDAGEEVVVRAAFVGCLEEKNTWLLSGDDPKFRAGCGALLLYYHERDLDVFERLETELRSLQSLSALMQGVPVNLEAVEVPDNPLGLMKAYHEAKRAQS